MYHLDFETRSELDIKVGAWAYSVHPSTEVLCVSVALGDERPLVVTCLDEFEDVHDAFQHLTDEVHVPVGAHNAFFERCIWENVMVARHGQPPIDPERWRCSAALAANFGLPRKLEMVAKALGLAERKDEEGHALMLRMSKPRKPTAAERGRGQAEPDPFCGECRGLGVAPSIIGHRCSCTSLNGPLWYGSREDLERLAAYCVQDVVVEREITRRLGELSPMELDVWHADQAVNASGVPVDLDLCRGALKIKAELDARANEELCEITGAGKGDKTLPTRHTQRDRIVKWVRSCGWELPNAQKETLDEALDGKGLKRIGGGKREEVTGSVRRVLEIRRAASKASTAKYQAAIDRATRDRWSIGPNGPQGAIPDQDRVRGSLIYYGAHTGRWAGSGLQTQNMPRDSPPKGEYEFACSLVSAGDLQRLEFFYPEPMAILKSCVRGIIRAPGGKVFLVGDYSAIEARVVFWLAGELRGLSLYRAYDKAPREALEPYCWMASRIFGRDGLEIQRANRDGDKEGEEQRFVGKSSVLGCGFGLGPRRFRDQYDVAGKLAKLAVKAYRESFPAVPDMWTELDEASVEAVRGSARPIPTCGGRILWGMRDGFLCARLPSGRMLRYPEPRVGLNRVTIETVDGEERTFERIAVNYKTADKGQWRRTWTWGGTLCIEEGTLVVTDHGPVPIERVEPSMLVWDGKEWVTHSGSILQGYKDTVEAYGVRMTPDHRVLTVEGWKRESESKGLDRAPCRLPDGYSLRGEQWEEIALAPPVRLRKHSGSRGLRVHEVREAQASIFLRLHSLQDLERVPHDARHDEALGLRGLVVYEAALPRPLAPGVQELWWPWHLGVRALARLLRELLERHGRDLRARALHRQSRQRRGLHPGELPLDHLPGAGTQPSRNRLDPYAVRTYAHGGCRDSERNLSFNALLPKRPGSARGSDVRSARPVYDLVDCGPRRRFVVLDKRGKPLIVHNCENVVQAVARDLLADALVRSHKLLAPHAHPIAHSHDELILEMHESMTEYTPEWFERFLCVKPAWADGLPVAAEAWSGPRYRK